MARFLSLSRSSVFTGAHIHNEAFCEPPHHYVWHFISSIFIFCYLHLSLSSLGPVWVWGLLEFPPL